MNESLETTGGSLNLLVGQVADEFLRRQEAGERPDVEGYAARHPQAAGLIRRVLTSLKALDASLARGGAAGDAMTGTLGDYRILREVGRGGMGVVYEAEQISLGRRVALKVLPLAAMMDPRHLQRFHNEARAAASLHHEHIVPVHGVGCERGVHFYAMQFIDGRTAAEVIAERRRDGQGGRDGRASDTAPIAAAATEPALGNVAYYRRVAGWGVEAAEALQHAHESGVVHRDVKPANLMLDGRGKLWVTDFGLAQVQADCGLTMTGDLVGTLRYMSPEQALGKRELVDHRADVYSLGVTLYELLTLQPAVEGGDREEILRRIAFAEPLPLRKHQPAIPTELETVVLKAVAKEPLDRYATARDLADDLRRYLENRPIRARRPTSWQHASKWAGRHQGMVLAAVAGLVVASATLAVSVWRIEVAREDAVHQRGVAEENAKLVGLREGELRRRLYPAEVRLAHRVWQLGDHSQAREVLRRQLPEPGQEDLRGFEWWFLWDRCRREAPQTLAGHKKRVYDLAFSPDGKTLATASEDRSVGLWEVESGRLVAMLPGHAKEADGVWWSPDGRVLASHAGDGRMHLWDVATRRRLEVIGRPGEDVCCVHFRPDGGLTAAVHAKGRVAIWEPRTGASRTLEGQVRYPRTAAFSRDGTSFAVGDGITTEVKVWDVPSGKQIGRTVRMGRYVDTVAFCPTGKLALAAGAVKVLNRGSYEEEFAWPPSTLASAVAFSADGAQLAFGGQDSLLQVWDLNARMRVEQFGKLNTHIFDVAFSPDGSLLAAGGTNGLVHLYRMARSQPEPGIRLGESASATNVSLAPDGKSLSVLLYSIQGDQMRLVDRATGDTRGVILASGTATIGESCFSHDGRFVALTDRSVVHLAEAATGRALPSTAGQCAAFVPGRPAIAIADDSGEVSLRELPSLEVVQRFPTHMATPTSLAFSPDGRTMVAGYGNGELRSWDARTGGGGDVLGRSNTPADHLSFSPTGGLIASAGRLGDAVRLWDPSGREPSRAVVCPSRLVRGLAFAPDGKTLAVAQMDDVTLVHVATGQELFSLGRQKPYSPGVAFTAGGESLVTGAALTRVAGIWELRLIRWDAPRR